MKRAIFCLGIVAGLVILALSSYYYILNTTENITEMIEEICDDVESENWDKITETAKKAEEIWEKFHKHRLFIVDKDHTVDITISMSRINRFAKAKNTSDLMEECEVIIMLLKLYGDKQRLDIYNVL